jgi:hypothetical protein
VSEHDDETRTKRECGKLDALDDRVRDDVPGDADHEEITHSLIEHKLRRDARIRAADDDRDGSLINDQLVLTIVIVRRLLVAEMRNKSFVAGVELSECVFGIHRDLLSRVG